MKIESTKLHVMFKLLEKITSVDKDVVWSSSNCDPFNAILSCLEDREKGMLACPSSCCCITGIASTNEVCLSKFNDSSKEFFDIRIRYGHLIMLVMREIANELKTANQEVSVKNCLISIKHLAVLSSAFQFFILTCVSPFLDQGLGIPLQLRSHLIKSWEKCTSNLDFRKAQLSLAGECVTALLCCNDSVRLNLLRKYCSDVVSIFEQLCLLDPCSVLIPVYEEIISKTDSHLLVCAFLGLLKPRSGVKPPKQFTRQRTFRYGVFFSHLIIVRPHLPAGMAKMKSSSHESWEMRTQFCHPIGKLIRAYSMPQMGLLAFYSTLKFISLSIGSRLSKILISKNGLSATLSSYEEINEQFWHNTPLLSAFAKQLALPPKNMKKMGYYKNIVSQFVQLISTASFSCDRISMIFSMFAEEMRKKNSIAGDIFIDDLLFKPWEILHSSAHVSWTDDHGVSLCLMKFWSDGKCGFLKTNPRFLSCAAVLLSLLSDSDGKKCPSMNVFDDIFGIVKCALKDVENMADFFLAFICDSSPCFELVQQPSLVQVTDVKPSLYGQVALSRIFLDRDEVLGRRVESSIAFLKKMDKPLSSRMFVEIACKSIEMYNNDSGRDSPRFISDHKANASVLPKLSWHFVAGVFFEHLQDSDIDCGDKNTILSLLKLAQEIFRSTVLYLENRDKAFDCLDVVAAECEVDSRLYATTVQNAKMAIGLTGAVIVAAHTDEQICSALLETCLILSSFADFVSALKRKDEDIMTLAADAQRLSSLFGEDRASVDVPHPFIRKMETSINITDSIRQRLRDDSPAERGGALLDAGRLIRSREDAVLLQLEEWLFEEMKGMNLVEMKIASFHYSDKKLVHGIEAIYSRQTEGDCEHRMNQSSVIERALFDSDSYVYLAAINALAEAACYNPKYLRSMISLFRKFERPSSSLESQNYIEEKTATNTQENEASIHTDVAVRSRLCEVIGKVFRELGDLGPAWMDECAGIFLSCFSEEEEILRASASQALAELILSCRGRNIEKYLSEIILVVGNILTSDTSALVRRSVVNLLRQTISSCGTEIFQIVRGRLRDLHRKLLHLWRFDCDHVVRLHAELALEEMKDAIKHTVLQETTSTRTFIP